MFICSTRSKAACVCESLWSIVNINSIEWHIHYITSYYVVLLFLLCLHVILYKYNVLACFISHYIKRNVSLFVLYHDVCIIKYSIMLVVYHIKSLYNIFYYLILYYIILQYILLCFMILYYVLLYYIVVYLVIFSYTLLLHSPRLNFPIYLSLRPCFNYSTFFWSSLFPVYSVNFLRFPPGQKICWYVGGTNPTERSPVVRRLLSLKRDTQLGLDQPLLLFPVGSMGLLYLLTVGWILW